MMFLYQRVKGTFLAVMSELDALHVVRNSAILLCHFHDFVLRHEQKFGLRIDEYANQPGAGYSVHFDSLACYPIHDQVPFNLGPPRKVISRLLVTSMAFVHRWARAESLNRIKIIKRR